MEEIDIDENINIQSLNLNPNVICNTGRYFETQRNESKMHKYYNIAIQLKYLPAYYIYGNWFNIHGYSEKMAHYYSLGIDLYLNNDYYKESEESIFEYDRKVVKMMEMVGSYYDNIVYPTEETKVNIIKYYLLAIERNSISSMFNLGHYYYECNDYENMFKYYFMAVELKDKDTMYELAIYYQNSRDFDNMRKYYLMALETETDIPTENIALNNGKKDFDLFNLKIELEKIEVKPMCLVKKLQEIGHNKDIMIFENKKKLFSKLNHIVECGICYETKLNIDLYCGHCYCIDCYSKLYKNPCPYCRF